MPVAVEHAGLEPALEEVAGAVVALVEPDRVEPVQALHAGREVGLSGLDQQVEVVVEQAPDVHRPAEPAPDLDEELEPRFPVEIVEHDRPLLDAAADDVVPGGARELAARDPRHGPTLARTQRPRNCRERTCVRDSPWDTSLADAGRADCG